MSTTFQIAVGETLDYTISWATTLGSDTVATSAWAVATGLTVGADSNTTTTTTIFLTAGAPGGSPVDVTNTITTAGGRTLVRTIQVAVIAKKYE